MNVPTRQLIPTKYGQPVLRSGGVGETAWCKENSVSQLQKGAGIVANLYGGAQSAWDDWAAFYLPVNQEYPLPLLTKPTQWSYYMTGEESVGINLVIWVHDPTNWSKRAEITQYGQITGLGKAAGWNTHVLDPTTEQFFFFGENTTGTELTKGPTNLYSLADFQADALFKNWVIYRYSWEYGFEADSTLDDAWLAEIMINGYKLPFIPNERDHWGGETKTLTYKTEGTSTAKQTMFSPRATKRIRIINVALGNLGSTSTEIEVYFGTGTNIDSAVTKAIYAGIADKDYASSDVVFPVDHGPVGAIGEVVSVRTAVDITTYGRVTISYREE